MFHIKFLPASLALLIGGISSANSAEWLTLPAKTGTSNGKNIVLISGDEEYRSEESCPMLAKILSQKYGFNCTVLFAINPDGGYIDPNYQKNISGTEMLDHADLMIIGTRFRQLPDDQIAHFASYLNAGKPVIGFRTATHAFSGPAQTNDFKWQNFGLNILGETWISHHGNHKVEGTRSFVETANSKNEILQGVGEIFATTDVYGIKNIDQNSATILLRGAVTASLDPKSKVIEGPKNNPMMPLAWTREYTAPNGATKGKAFCTTLGASTDFTDENLRRLFVNASLNLTGLKVPAKADVNYIDPFEPTRYSAIDQKNYYKKRNLKPDDYILGKSPATGIPNDDSNQSSNDPDPERHAPHAEPASATLSRAQAVAPPSQGEKIVFVGNGLAERDLYYSRLETELYLRNSKKKL